MLLKIETKLSNKKYFSIMTTFGPSDLNSNVMWSNLINQMTRSIQNKILAAMKRFSFFSHIDNSLSITASKKRKQPVISK